MRASTPNGLFESPCRCTTTLRESISRVRWLVSLQATDVERAEHSDSYFKVLERQARD